MVDRFAVLGKPCSAIGHQPLSLRRTDGLAEIRFTRFTVFAFAALGGIEWNDMIARRELVTPSPTASTIPPPSWPRMAGNFPSGSLPDNVNASVWQTPVATMRTSTSPFLGRHQVHFFDSQRLAWAPGNRCTRLYLIHDPVLSALGYAPE